MRDVGFVLYDGVQALDVVGPYEAFQTASAQAAEPAYRLHLLSLGGRSVRAETGLVLGADGDLGCVRPLHTLLVPGGAGARRLPRDERLVAAIGAQAAAARRVVNVCTGAFLLAEAGLARGRRLATHWAYAGQLAERFPDVEVERDALYICDRGLWSAAGILAGVDLALALIEADLGQQAAVSAARFLVIYLRRSGSQQQFSAPLRAQGRAAARLAALADWVRDNVARPVDVDQLAARAGLSARHLRRVLRAETGLTPARFVEDVRLDVARELLTAGAAIKQVAAAAGFASADAFRRAFHRRFRLSPLAYRERFGAGGPAAAPADDRELVTK